MFETNCPCQFRTATRIISSEFLVNMVCNAIRKLIRKLSHQVAKISLKDIYIGTVEHLIMRKTISIIHL